MVLQPGCRAGPAVCGHAVHHARAGELLPRADEQPAWTDDDFRLSAEGAADLAENAIINRDSTTAEFEAWWTVQKPPRLAKPCSTATCMGHVGRPVS
ncbi:hypothetical protein [Streptomyces sp. NRRL F-2664]|uniref:hypothetical protein n=1 Tax=Streptomyces sp. NRRL F-2664 TaxID=1463842 RepID=UPI0004C94880|nr:hypothetical protein [Streptomyces sp. NRRL F-2664]